MTGFSQLPHGKMDDNFRLPDIGGPGLSSIWPESKLKNKAEPKSNLGGGGGRADLIQD